MPNDDEVFRLRPQPDDLRTLEAGYLARPAGNGKSSEAADKVALDAGRLIREGARSKANLKAIVAWKNSQSRFWGRIERQFERNDAQSVAAALNTAVTAATGAQAVAALTNLAGIQVRTASAILAAIFPEKYTVMDQLALRALGVTDAEVSFYLFYNNYCRSLATENEVDLRQLDRALWEWGKTHAPRRRAYSESTTGAAKSRAERDGVPILPLHRSDAVVTMDTVNKLRDE